jgi:tRNA A-37 threonylcarbamoyl transferase component Bud32
MVGSRVKHYEIESVLGKGGMGVVYRARDTRLGRPVALKFLSEELTKDPARRDRFLREARAACAVNHPAIAQVYDVDEAEGGVFMAMELVEGKTVRALIKGRELDLLGSLEVGAQVASGLSKAHEAGIVHRDIKPENVIVTPDGHAKILDFGLAKLLDPPKETGSATGDELSHMETMARTQAGMVLGTLRYMSPEQARGQDLDHRSDIFSLGVMIYEMVTGQLPFSGNSPIDTLHAIAFEETRPITALRANLPPSLQRVVSRCLRKRAQDRYADTKELTSDLRAVQREVESGISSRVPLGLRLQERILALRDLAPGEWAWPIGIGLVAIAALVALARSAGEVFPFLFMFGVGGLLLYRFIRNRRYRATKKFMSKARRLQEVQIIAVDALRITVVADKALARTYVRVNALVDAMNARMFFGEPFKVVVRDDLTPEETKALLTGPGVLYVREDRDKPRS